MLSIVMQCSSYIKSQPKGEMNALKHYKTVSEKLSIALTKAQNILFDTNNEVSKFKIDNQF